MEQLTDCCADCFHGARGADRMDLAERIRTFAISSDAIWALAETTVTLYGKGRLEAGSQNAIARPQHGKRRGPRLEGSAARAYLAPRDPSGGHRSRDILVSTSGYGQRP
jgi:hypothetical protein